MSKNTEFDNHFALWNLESNLHSPEWPLFRTSESKGKVKERAMSIIGSGLASLSAFIIAFNQLRSEGAIVQVRQPNPQEVDESLTPAQFHSLPSAVVQRRFKNDPDFRSQVENLMAAGKI